MRCGEGGMLERMEHRTIDPTMNRLVPGSERIFDDVSRILGPTPLVRLQRLARGGAEVLLKLESFNPAGSVKDRLGIAVVDEAERRGALRAGGTIVEGTSGNTGIALAMVGAARGYRVVLAMPERVSVERRLTARAYGAEVVVMPADSEVGIREFATQIAAGIPGAVLAHQFESPVNAEVHRRTTAQEILVDTGGRVDAFIAGVGTGGTITGVGRELKERLGDVRVIAVEPAESPLLSEGWAAPHEIQGIGVNFVPDVLDPDTFDEVVDVSADDAVATARALAAQEGIFSGFSTGAIVHAAVEVARRPEFDGRRVVAMMCDIGERYLSTRLWNGAAEADADAP